MKTLIALLILVNSSASAMDIYYYPQAKKATSFIKTYIEETLHERCPALFGLANFYSSVDIFEIKRTTHFGEADFEVTIFLEQENTNSTDIINMSVNLELLHPSPIMLTSFKTLSKSCE